MPRGQQRVSLFQTFAVSGHRRFSPRFLPQTSCSMMSSATFWPFGVRIKVNVRVGGHRAKPHERLTGAAPRQSGPRPPQWVALNSGLSRNGWAGRGSRSGGLCGVSAGGFLQQHHQSCQPTTKNKYEYGGNTRIHGELLRNWNESMGRRGHSLGTWNGAGC